MSSDKEKVWHTKWCFYENLARHLGKTWCTHTVKTQWGLITWIKKDNQQGISLWIRCWSCAWIDCNRQLNGIVQLHFIPLFIVTYRKLFTQKSTFSQHYLVLTYLPVHMLNKVILCVTKTNHSTHKSACGQISPPAFIKGNKIRSAMWDIVEDC